MERVSDKHSPRVDDQLKHRNSHAEEFRRDVPDDDQQHGPYQEHRPDVPQGSPDVMPDSAVEARSEIARFLSPSAFPARTDELIASAKRNFAPDGVVERLRMLPDGRFENLEEVWEALGGEHETNRA